MRPALSRLELAMLDPAALLEALGSRPEGLEPEEVDARLRAQGPNRLPQPVQRSPLRALAAQFTHLFALALWGAAALSFVGRMPELGWAILVVLLVNGLFAFALEYRAERAAQALEALMPARVAVRRGGQRQVVQAEALVVGDLLLLEEGARVPADARVLEASGLQVDNSALTGESEPVQRCAQAPERAPAEEVDCADLVFAGTWVMAGSATAGVLCTGAATRLGALSRLTGAVERRPTPLRRSLERSVRIIAAVALGTGGLFLGGVLALGMPLGSALLFTVGVVVALVPEGLLPTLTLSLAMGATRMARRRVLVRHLEAVETLGAATVICTDKTGTLTANQMTAASVWTPAGALRVTGVGYRPSGTLLEEKRPLTPDERTQLAPLLRAASLCGDAHVAQREGGWHLHGDPTEGALVVLAAKGGVERAAAERAAPRVQAFPFSSERRRMSTVHVLPSGEHLVLAKGAPEALLPCCVALWTGAGTLPLGPAQQQSVRAQAEALAAGGLRVLALAQRQGEPPADASQAERELVLLGLVGLADPVRPEVPDAIAHCRSAGIRVVMVTGDHPATAVAVARRIGLRGEGVRLGWELPADEAALGALLQGGVEVLARVQPEQKLAIARALQARGEVVAMTGDGVNDAPALRRADIGVAMGASGTDVARAAADLVLLDDNFSHLVEAVEEGRAAFANIRRFLTYHLTDNVAELAPLLVWALSGGRIPLLLSVLQILALDIGTDLLPALALGAERPGPEGMRSPPRALRVPLLDLHVLGRAFGFLGPLEAAVSLGLAALGAGLYLGWRPGLPPPGGDAALALLSTLVFSSIVLMQMANAFCCRSNPASLFAIGPLSNRLLVGAVAVELLALLAFVYLPALAGALGHRALALPQWALLSAAPALLLGAEELRKAWVRQRSPAA